MPSRRGVEIIQWRTAKPNLVLISWLLNQGDPAAPGGGSCGNAHIATGVAERFSNSGRPFASPSCSSRFTRPWSLRVKENHVPKSLRLNAP